MEKISLTLIRFLMQISNERSLGELIDIKHGFAFSGKNIVSEEQDRILITPGHFNIGGGFRNNHKKYFDSEDYRDGYELESGELIVTMTDLSKSGDTLGYSAIVPNIPGKILLHNQRIGKVILRSNELDISFCHYLMRSEKYRQHILATCSGSTVKHTSPSRILDYKFLLPPLAEQKTIAQILGSLDDKIELNRRMNETLEAMAQTLFKSWFVDFDPVIDNALAAGNTIPDEFKEKAAIRQELGGERKLLPDDIRLLFPSEFEHNEEMEWIPKGWAVGPLRSVASYCLNRIETSELTLENYISTENMLAEKKGICAAAKLPKLKTISSYQSGNILISNIRPYFKKIWFAEGSGGYSNDVLSFTVKTLGTEEYLLNLLWQDSFFDYMMKTAKGSKMPRGDKNAILNWRHIIPLANSRRAFSEIVRKFYQKKSVNLKKNTTLHKLRNILLTKLLSGELNVEDMEGTL